MKRVAAVVLLLVCLLSLVACGKPGKIVHCDACGKEIPVRADSDMNEDWIILCEDCKQQLEPEIEKR